jgi:amidase
MNPGRATLLFSLLFFFSSSSPLISYCRYRVDDEICKGIEGVASSLERLGVHVDRKARPKFNLADNVRAWHHLTAINGLEKKEKEENERKVSLKQFRVAQENQVIIREAWEEFFLEYDILLCPSYASLAFLKDEKEDDIVGRKVEIVCDGEKTQLGYYKSLFWAFLTNVGHLPSTTFPIGLFSSPLA